MAQVDHVTQAAALIITAENASDGAFGTAAATVALTHATLYLADQQRLANLIAMATWNDGVLRSGTLQYEDAEDEATERMKIDRWFAEVRLGVRAT